MKEKSTIALVDDERNILTSLRMALEAEGYKVRTYNDGASALEALTEEPADLGVFDIRMPRMDGIEFMERLKNTHADKKIPIIITSNDSSLDTISKGAEFGIRGYIVKSSQPMKTIIETIDRVIAETDK